MTPQRVQLSRQLGYRKPEGAIVVSRPSKWGNPYRRILGYSQTESVRLFEHSLEGALACNEHGMWDGRIRPRAITDMAWLLDELRGHDLACWCPLDQPCHADVLLRLANA